MPGAVPHAELPAYYGLANVYTMPSTGDEPFTLTIPEAMAAGLPVVATATGGTVEIVEEGVNGLLVPPHDPAAMADGIRSYLDNPEQARRHSQAALERYEALHQPREMARKLENLFC